MILEELDLSTESILRYAAALELASIKFNMNLIDVYGGHAHSIIKPNELKSACYRPFSSAFGEYAFSTDYEKIAALLDGLIQAHSFSDGNKRTAIAMTEYFCSIADIKLTLSENQKYSLVHDVESHKYSITSLAKYIEKNSSKY